MSRLTRDAFPAWFDGLDAFLLDCDGVLWRGDAAIAGAKETVALLRSLGKRVVFVTNGSTKTRASYAEKLASQGIPAVADDIVTSAWATVKYMKDQGIAGKVYVVGEIGLDEELRAGGFEPFGLAHGDVRDIPVPFTVDPDVKAVVVGLDRNLCYYKLAYASCCVREVSGCRFIATNPDTTFPQDGSILPGGGSVVKFVEAAVGHPPEVVIGKPSQYLLDTILRTFNLDPTRTCMIGDQLTTDIKLGRRGGLPTLLVLSGVTQEEELAHIDDEMQVPDVYVDSISDLHAFYNGDGQH